MARLFDRPLIMSATGAGTGGATSAVLEALDSAYSSYTYTDISSGFFEKAAARFASEGDKLIFKMLDAEKQPVSQGYQPNTYDVSQYLNMETPISSPILMK